MISIEQKQEYFDYINKILDVKFDPKLCVCFASLSNDGKINGVCVVDRFTQYGCELSVASTTPRFLTRDFLDVIFHYVFITAKKTRITAMIEEDNHKAMRLNQGLGFVIEGTLKGWYGKKDGIVLRMLKEECRWLKGQ